MPLSAPSSTMTPVGLEWVPAPLYRLSLEQYEAMVQSGVFTARDRFHLINGFLVAKMTQNDPHCTADGLCRVALDRVIPHGWHVRSAKPVRLPAQVSKPEPDQCVVRGAIRDYSQRSPEACDVALIVEVSESSLAEDRKLARIYGDSGIPVYWIVNLVDRQVEVYTLPYADGYHARQDFALGQDIPVVVDGLEIARIGVADILP
jgi:Uma2 family endonuclease